MSIPVLSVKDDKGNLIPIPVIKGDKGDAYVLTEADKEEIANMINLPIDQAYNPESTKAQSGKAVAEAIASVGGSGGTWETIADITLDETNGDVNSLNVQIPKETVDIVKQCTELMCFVGFTAKNDYTASKVYLRCYFTGLNLPVLYATNNALAKDKQARTLSRTIFSDVGNLSFTAPLTQYELFNSSTASNNYTCQSFNDIKDRNETVYFNANLSFSSTQTETQTFGAGAHIKLVGRKA